jgi:DNA polymerase-3 subunit epsilon
MTLMYLFFDTETTGLPRNYRAPVTNLTNWPRMVQIAWLATDKAGKECATGEFIVKPEGFTIPPDAARIHGITTQRALAEGTPLAEVLKEFLAAMGGCMLLVAHNFEYDSRIVGAELLRSAIPNRLQKKKHICTMQASTQFCRLPGPYGYKWPRLEELYRVLFQEPPSETHRALADVRACAKCFFELRRRGVIP